jgi:hypothetical protein
VKPNFVLRENQGQLFKNAKVDGNAPDFSGDLNLGGELFKLKAWIKQGATGPFLSIGIRPQNKLHYRGRRVKDAPLVI